MKKVLCVIVAGLCSSYCSAEPATDMSLVKRKLQQLERRAATDKKLVSLRRGRDVLAKKYQAEFGMSAVEGYKDLSDKIVKLQKKAESIQKEIAALQQKRAALRSGQAKSVTAEQTTAKMELRKKMQQAQKAYDEYKRELLSKTPEGKNLLAQLAALKSKYAKRDGSRGTLNSGGAAGIERGPQASE